VVIDYQPTPKQTLFQATDANEVLYGGAPAVTPILNPDGKIFVGIRICGD